MAGKVIPFVRPGHVRAPADSAGSGWGRGTPAGHSASGQWSENHCIALSSRRTWMSAPDSMAESFLPSSKARELTVERPTPSCSAYVRATTSKCSMLDMAPISVILPRKSTAILPNAPSTRPGYITGMELSEILAWVDFRKAALGIKSDAAVSKKAGHPDVIRNMRRGLSRPKTAALRDLAKVLGNPPPGLFDEPSRSTGLPTIEEMEAELVALRRQAEELEITINVLRARKRAG